MKDVNFEQIAKKLREIRISKGYSQEYVAKKADVNTSHICNIENLRVKVSLSTLIAICNALGITLDYILCDEYISATNSLESELIKDFRECTPEVQQQILKIVKVLK